jgi:hypothetical protein
MEAACSSETLLNFYQNKRHRVLESNALGNHSCENLKPILRPNIQIHNNLKEFPLRSDQWDSSKTTILSGTQLKYIPDLYVNSVRVQRTPELDVRTMKEEHQRETGMLSARTKDPGR